jgi:hypothetical protein
MPQITYSQLQNCFEEIFDYKETLTPQTDLRMIIKDSIDLGEVLVCLNLEVDLKKFKEVVTAENFLNLVNQKYDE